MTTASPSGAAAPRLPVGAAFGRVESALDLSVLDLFESRSIRRFLRTSSRALLESIWEQARRELGPALEQPAPRERKVRRAAEPAAGPLEVHRRLVSGLPGEALFISSAMAFDSMAEALPFFDVSAKTARSRLGERLTPAESEMALRIGRTLAMAGRVLGSLEAARAYLRTGNFALGGAVPRDLLRTAAGEQVVLAELQAQADGGPV